MTFVNIKTGQTISPTVVQKTTVGLIAAEIATIWRFLLQPLLAEHLLEVSESLSKHPLSTGVWRTRQVHNSTEDVSTVKQALSSGHDAGTVIGGADADDMLCAQPCAHLPACARMGQISAMSATRMPVCKLPKFRLWFNIFGRMIL